MQDIAAGEPGDGLAADTRRAELDALGWSDWFEQQPASRSAEALARVAAVDRDQLLLLDAAGPFRGKLAGSYRHHHRLSHELPCVGDWVCLKRQPGEDFGVVHGLLERRASLRRRAAGSVAGAQMIAANVDCVFIVQSCHLDFNLKRLERYLVMVADGGAEACVLLTKSDLVSPAELADRRAEIEAAGIAAPVVALSNLSGRGLDELDRLLLPAKTYCFVGSSGVGKSTLINRLLGREAQVTQAVSGTGEGRHTTVRRELIRLNHGALVIDNPGMREFGIAGAEEGLASSYGDIGTLASGCRYRDCTHTGEPGCAVREALHSGDLGQDHFENYLKLKAESEFYELSHAGRRKRDRDFGKFLKSAKKHFDRE